MPGMSIELELMDRSIHFPHSSSNRSQFVELPNALGYSSQTLLGEPGESAASVIRNLLKTGTCGNADFETLKTTPKNGRSVASGQLTTADKVLRHAMISDYLAVRMGESIGRRAGLPWRVFG